MRRPEVQAFTHFMLMNANALAPEIGYVASPNQTYAADSQLRATVESLHRTATPIGAGPPMPVAAPTRATPVPTPDKP